MKKCFYLTKHLSKYLYLNLILLRIIFFIISFRFYNFNAASIRAVMVANCLCPAPTETEQLESQQSTSSQREERGNPPSHRDLSTAASSANNQVPEEPEVLHHASSRLQ